MDNNQDIPSDILQDIQAANLSSTPETPPLPEGDLPSAPSTGEIAKEVGIGAGQGLTEGLLMTGAPYIGTKAGMALGSPFFPPFGTAVGGTLGFLVGTGAGYLAQSSINDMFPGVSREDLAPYREGGKTFGQTMAMVPYAFAIPVQRTQQIATLIRNMDPALQNVPNGIAAGRTGEFLFKTLSAVGETAQKYPKSFIAGETMAGIGSGIGAGIAESQAPGEAGPRFAGEVAGGILAPGRMLFTSAGNTKDFLGTLLNSISRESREGRAANKLYTILQESGEDPTELLRKLSRDFPEGARPTASQLTGSTALSVLETTLAKNNAQYRGEVLKQAEDSLRAYKVLAQKLQDIGTPESLTKAAELRQNYFNETLSTRLLLAEAEAARLASKITKDTPQSRAAIGEIVKNQTELALKDAREHERFLWSQAYKDSVETVTKDGKEVLRYKEVNPSSVGEAFLDIASSMTDARFKSRMPAEIKQIMKGIGIDEKAIARYKQGKQTQEYLDTGIVPEEYLTRTVEKPASKIILPEGVRRPATPTETESIFKNTDAQELIKARGDLLSFAREASAKGELDNASFYGRMAEAILDDLQQLNSPAYDQARQFSRTLNDVFTRTYAGDVAMGRTKTGAEKIPAEILVTRAFGSGADATAMRMQKIQDAVGMMRTQYDNAVQQYGIDSPQAMELKPFADAALKRVDSIYDAQQRVLRLAASKSLDPQTGRVNPASLQKFVNENKTMLDEFGVTSDLTDAIRAENMFRAVSDQNSYANNRLLKQTAFAQVLSSENPTRSVTEVLNSKHPVKNFTNIAKLAKAGGPDAADGLKSIVYDYAFTKAGGIDNFDVGAFRKALFEPISPGQPSLLNILRSQDMISRKEVTNLLEIIRPMERIEKAKGNERLLDKEISEGADAVTQLAMRVVGSRIGTAASAGGPSSLIAASAGSQAVRNIFDKQPTMLIQGIIEEATKDPTLMQSLLARGTSEGEKRRIARSMHAYLGAAGLNYATYEEPPEEPQQNPSVRARDMLNSLPPAPVTRGTPNLQLPTAQGAPSAPRQPPGQPPAAPPAPGQPPASQSRSMLQRLFPYDTTLQAAPPMGQ